MTLPQVQRSSRRNFPCYRSLSQPWLSPNSWHSINLYVGANDCAGMWPTLDQSFTGTAISVFGAGNLVIVGCLDAGLIDYRSDKECRRYQ